MLGCVLGAVSFYLLYVNAYVGGIMRWLCEQSLVRSARVYYSPGLAVDVALTMMLCLRYGSSTVVCPLIFAEFYYPPRPPPLGEAKEE